MIEIITTRSGKRKVIFHSPINKLVKKWRNKDNSTSHYKFYTCLLPPSLKKYMGYIDKIYYKVDDNTGTVFLSNIPTSNEYTIKKNGLISIPRTHFNEVEPFNEVLFIVDLNKSIDVPYVVMELS